MNEILKPCPKCGADNSQALGARRIGNRFVGAIKYYVRCTVCGFEVSGYLMPTAAVLAWNERSDKEEEQNVDSD